MSTPENLLLQLVLEEIGTNGASGSTGKTAQHSRTGLVGSPSGCAAAYNRGTETSLAIRTSHFILAVIVAVICAA